MWRAVRRLSYIQMWLAIMPPRKFSVKLLVHRSQQTAVKLLDFLNSYKTSKGSLFSWFFRTWEFFSTCSSPLWFSRMDKFYHAQTVGFKSCICEWGNFIFFHLKFSAIQFAKLKEKANSQELKYLNSRIHA